VRRKAHCGVRTKWARLRAYVGDDYGIFKPGAVLTMTPAPVQRGLSAKFLCSLWIAIQARNRSFRTPTLRVGLAVFGLAAANLNCRRYIKIYFMYEMMLMM